MAESVFAVIFNDPRKRGYEKVSTDVSRLLEGQGYDALFQSNEFPASREQVEDPDFHVSVFAHGDRLMPYTAFDETPSPPQTDAEKLADLMELASHVLRRVKDKADEFFTSDAGDIGWPLMALTSALDRWDEFVSGAEDWGKYPGIAWPIYSDGATPPAGWTWVERDDEMDLYEDDEAAARALIEKHGVPATEIRWFYRNSLKPVPENEHASGASVAINIPESEATS
jgi:hypothetical protein